MINKLLLLLFVMWHTAC